MNKTTETHPVFRHPAEARGYGVAVVDAHGGDPRLTGRPPAGVVLANPDGDVVWIPAEDLAVAGELLIRMHVKLAQLARKTG